MERAGPRIYVPLGLPDHGSAQPTYAVLEFVGFSAPAPPASAPHLLQALPSPPPAMLCLPPASSSAAPSSFFPLSITPPNMHPLISTPPHNTLISAPSQIPFSHFSDPNTLYFPSPPHLLMHHPRTLPSSRLDIVNLESPPSSPSSIAPSSASSVSRDSPKDKYPHSSTYVATPMGASSVVSPTGLNKPMVSFSSSAPSDAASSMACGPSRPMIPFHSSADAALSKSMVNFSSSECSASGLSKPMTSFNSACEGGEVTPTQISVSQTDRETIVHTHSSNFRDVVRQLTGASSDDQDLLPVTLPARLANRVNNANTVQNGNMNTEMTVPAGTGAGAAGACVGVGASAGASKDQLGLRKAPLKLHERRKSSMKNLEKITTAFNHHAATELSPLNPSPVTPLASDFERFCNASTPTSQGSSGLSSPINLISKGRSSLDGSSERRGAGEHHQESGCFYMQRPPPGSVRPLPPPGPPEKAGPTLLSLFPESPACSPRDR